MPSRYQKSTKPRIRPTGRKAPPTGTDRDLTLATMTALFNDENAAREFIEKRRWPNGPVCPHCGCKEVYQLTARPGSKEGVAPGVRKCKACRKKFTVRIGTVFEESKIPLRKWLMAMHLMTSSKKGISSHQIARELDVTVKTAWFLTQRIRECMKQGGGMLGAGGGTVEADECYLGGKPRPKAGEPRTHARGRGTAKTPVLVLVERKGGAVCRPLPNVTAKELRKHVTLIDPTAMLMTDEWKSYGPVGKRFAAHQRVNHGKGEYAAIGPDGEWSIHNNTAESFFALLRRGHYGVFHQLSKHHLHRYCNEFAFRWSHRYVTDGERMVAAIRGAEGKRLMYK